MLWILAMLAMGRADAAPESNAVPPSQVRVNIHRILSESEFRPEVDEESSLSRGLKWIDTEWHNFLKFLNHLFGNDGPDKGAASGPNDAFSTLLMTVLMAVFVVGAIALIALLIKNIIQARGNKPKATNQKAHVHDIDTAEADAVSEPEVWMTHANELAAKGDYRRALRAIFLGALLQLDRSGAIQYNRAKTNGDYVRMLGNFPVDQLVTRFRRLVSEFEYRWYGDRSTGKEDYEKYRLAYEEMRSLNAPTPTSTVSPSKSRSANRRGAAR